MLTKINLRPITLFVVYKLFATLAICGLVHLMPYIVKSVYRSQQCSLHTYIHPNTQTRTHSQIIMTTGSCYCGKIRIEFTGEPEMKVRMMPCSDLHVKKHAELTNLSRQYAIVQTAVIIQAACSATIMSSLVIGSKCLVSRKKYLKSRIVGTES
jgi:hypothetical protein